MNKGKNVHFELSPLDADCSKRAIEVEVWKGSYSKRAAGVGGWWGGCGVWGVGVGWVGAWVGGQQMEAARGYRSIGLEEGPGRKSVAEGRSRRKQQEAIEVEDWNKVLAERELRRE